MKRQLRTRQLVVNVKNDDDKLEERNAGWQIVLHCVGFGFAFDILDELDMVSDGRRRIENFSEDERNGGPVNGVRRTLQQTEDSDPSSLFDSVFMSMSDTLNSINTFESSDQTPDDKPQNTTTNRIPLAQRDTTR